MHKFSKENILFAEKILYSGILLFFFFFPCNIFLKWILVRMKERKNESQHLCVVDVRKDMKEGAVFDLADSI